MEKVILRILVLCFLFPFFSFVQPVSNSLIVSDTFSINENHHEENMLEGEYVANENNQALVQWGEEISFTLRRVKSEHWNKLKKDKRFVYTKKMEEKTKEVKQPLNPNLSFFNSDAFKIILYTIVFLFLAYVIYLFLKNNNISFTRKKIKSEIEVSEPWDKVEEFEEWDQALNTAIARGDYRLATRILYLQSLQKLSRKEIVLYREDKTNWYYVMQLQRNELFAPFKTLTIYFDYVWYGEYPLNEESFTAIKNKFHQLHAQIDQ